MKFTLTIDLGNDAMLEAEDVAAALRRVAVNLVEDPVIDPGSTEVIRESNGNTIGEWRVTE